MILMKQRGKTELETGLNPGTLTLVLSSLNIIELLYDFL